jgi:hypothetical protein
MRKDISNRRNPLLTGEATLDFGEINEELVITDDQKADAFLSKWMEKVDPFIRYESYFKTSAKDDAHILLEVKRYYKKLVVEEEAWTERKYVAVINDCFKNKVSIGPVTLDVQGRIYDRNNKSGNGTRRSGSSNTTAGRRRR